MVDRQANELNFIEDLPNELFGQILSYLNGIDAVVAFSYLNTRFQCLLEEYCRRFDFKGINKIKFDIIFEQYDTQWCKSLRLSNDDDTHGQIEYFFQFYSLIDHFSQLKSLSLLQIESINISYLLSQILFLTNLVSLTLKPICGRIMSKFGSLKLKRLAVTSCRNTEWIKNFPQLESLEYIINNCCWDRIVLSWPSKLKHLRIVFKNDDTGVLVPQSLEDLSQLITLEIYQKELGKSFPNGHVWKQLIRSSLPLLKKFKFYIQFDYGYLSVKEVKKVISSFSTPFYLDEKKWFVRCDIFTNDGTAIIYSLPFPFDQYTVYKNSSDGRVLTLSNMNKNNSSRNTYENMKILIVKSLSECKIEDKLFTKSDENLNIFNLINHHYFNSVQRFHLLPNYNCHRHEDEKEIFSKNFCILLNKLPHLYALEIHTNDLQILINNLTNTDVCTHLSEKIRSLKLYSNKYRRQHFDGDELDQIIHVFAAKCQHLSICILSPIDTVISLLRDMQQLFSLHVLVQIKTETEITMKWLEKQHIGLNYSNCFIVNDQQNYYFWLGRY